MDPAVTLRCYEPAGRVLSLSGDVLLRHVLGIGSTGSGKTTALVNPILEQVLAWSPTHAEAKPGLLVLDPKGDETPEKVLAFARAAGREQDVAVLSARGNCHYDFFGGLSRLDQVEQFTTRLLSGSREMGSQNAYWTEARRGYLETVLVLLLSSGLRITFESGIEFLRALLFSGDVKQSEPALEFVRKLVSAGNLPPVVRRRLESALVEITDWRLMDCRTKELHRSTLHNALRPLLSPAGLAYFDETKGCQFNVRAVLQGKILVATCNAVVQPQLAALLFRLLKQDFFAAVHTRTNVRPGEGRLCGLIVDEYPLSASPDDTDKLATCRSKGAFVVACAQSLSALDEVLGRRARESLLANFCNQFFFNSREDLADQFAATAFGYRELDRPNDAEYGDLLLQSLQPRVRQLVCPAGSLARLGEHQAYVKLADGSVTETPVWLAPTFLDIPATPSPVQKCELQAEVKRLREQEEDKKLLDLSVPDFLVYMHRQGHRLHLSPEVVMAAWQVSASRRRFSADGLPSLADLPTCWRVGVARFLRRKPKLVSCFEGFSTQGGVLWPKLVECSTWWGHGPLVLPEQLNLFVYPSLWRPLRKRHHAQLWRERPDLRAQLGSSADDEPAY